MGPHKHEEGKRGESAVRFGVSVPADLLKQFDEVVSKVGMKRLKALRWRRGGGTLPDF
ncbi:MAG: hypothetical protein J7J65_07380 [Candidatus Korarchaeota archaeon]|nr:hypothetical protein [Candidatus Korarchaeota archaeon]